ncbi:hypothetical protein FXF51_41145 [Nonomuraea sp. PA05]|uniref:hypothetical protein n=1 Tax=Nonomuraea sp. PA05 TaxID=2604466 RepID=UPI0011D4D6CC|nr:hypothetical protein [Nonomuraea sp. PA05]TYB57231.1 hypothetical protein FXF51_41145 [Nonomuraea sp. PA05]
MRRRVSSALVTAPFALTLLLTGCGSGEGGGADVASVSGGAGDKAVASAQPSADSQDKALKFAQCMRENGIDMPDPDSSGKMAMTFDAPQEKVQAAEEACRQYAPSGGQQIRDDPQMAENLRKLARCMRDNGVEAYPDPEGSMMRITKEAGEDPDLKAAEEKCQQQAADAGPGDS